MIHPEKANRDCIKAEKKSRTDFKKSSKRCWVHVIKATAKTESSPERRTGIATGTASTVAREPFEGMSVVKVGAIATSPVELRAYRNQSCEKNCH